MLTLSNLQTIIVGHVDGITGTNQVLESPGGYDGIISLIETKAPAVSVVLEHNEMGNLSIRPGGFMTSSQSIWVMEMAGANDDRRTVQQRCWSRLRDIIGLLTNEYNYGSSGELAGWDWDDMPFGLRNAGPNYTGYEMVMHFAEDIDLSYHAPVPDPTPTPTPEPTEPTDE